ncbi:MAG: pilus (MSHA type) biogenesis protein MshL [Gallionella sp.]|jgi:general secretion pathway protein D
MYRGLNNKKQDRLLLTIAALCTTLGACTNLPKAMTPSDKHIALPQATTPGSIPPLSETAPLPPPPKATRAAERYSIVVNNVLAQEILFALARDAKLNIEIHPGITGTVTMNLLDRTLPEILDAIARQVDMRYELNGSNLAIMQDSPYLKSYQIEYPNVARDAKNSINMSTSIAVIGQGQGGGGGSNGSNSSIDNISNNQFWETLTENIKDLLRETDKKLPEGVNETEQPVAPQTNTVATNLSSKPGAVAALPAQIQSQNTIKARRVTYREAAYVIANPETGIISVRANARQHAAVREFIDKVMNNARRQVLIEATIVEVSLSDQYQQGIDWSLLRTLGLSLTQVSPAGALATMGTISYTNPGRGGMFNLSGSIKLLENFGKLHVLSSPKLSVLNNQTGLVKVVDETVYFTVTVTQGTINPTTGLPTTLPTYSTTVHTVPVGFMMYVTPQIGADAEVTLNLRPTITRILSYANDPNPALIDPVTHIATINRIPQIQTREMESILRVRNGDIAVLGGLMQDTRTGNTSQIPGIGSIPGIGELFKARNDSNGKTELVIFLRPVILNQESQYDLVRQFKDPTASDEWQKATRKAEVTP